MEDINGAMDRELDITVRLSIYSSIWKLASDGYEVLRFEMSDTVVGVLENATEVVVYSTIRDSL